MRLKSVTVSVETWPCAIAAGANAFVTAPEAIETTFTLAALTFPTPPAGPVPVTLPIGIAFVNVSPVAAPAGRRAQTAIVQTPGLAPTPATIVPSVQRRPASAAVGGLPVVTPAASVPVNVPPVQPGPAAVKNPLPASNSVIWFAPFFGRTSRNVTPVTGPPEKLLIVTVNFVHCPGATFARVTVLATESWAFAVSVAVTGPGLA